MKQKFFIFVELATCYELNCVPLNFICWNSNPQSDCIRQIIQIKWGQMVGLWNNGTSVLIRKERDTRSHSLPPTSVFLSAWIESMWGHEKVTIYKQEETSHQKPTLKAFWSWTSSFPNCEKINFSCLGHLLFSILLW